MAIAAQAAQHETKFDQRGMGAWIALMIVGFFIWWPLGLAILAYLAWSGKMGCWKRGERHASEALRDAPNWWRQPQSSGNHAFDEYRTETLRRLEDEQREFKDFLERLRFAKDKTEFDQFMAERRNRANQPPQSQTPQTQS
jgi:hypothetical protein